MRITLAQLEALVWTARLGSVSAAAAQLSVTQSTLSLRLRDLSLAIGSPMLRRQGRQMTLTAEGERVLEHASVISEELEKLQDRAQSRQIAGIVRMGISEAVAMAGLPSIIALLSERYPLLRLDVAIGASVDLERDLLAHRIDLAFGINLHETPQLRVEALGVQEAVWLAKSDLGLPDRVRPRDLGQTAVLSNPGPSPMYQQTITWFRHDGITPRQMTVSNSITVIAHMVSAGVGVAILPRRLAEAEIAAGRVVALKADPPLEHSWMCAASRIDDQRPAINAVLGVSREVIEELNWLTPGG